MTDPSNTRARRLLAAIILALFAASVAYRLLIAKNLEHSALVFVGIPALLAFMLLQTRPRTAIGTVNKVIALALCLSGVLFGEGLICIMMAAPIFFLIGTIVGVFINWARGVPNPGEGGGSKWRGVAGILVLPLSTEGVIAGFEFNRSEQVAVTRVVAASPDAVRAALAATPRFDRTLPAFLRIGFPTPGRVSGAGLDLGDRRSIEFLHGEHHNGALVMHVSGADSSSVRFSVVSDSSYITHWLAWQEAAVRWEPAGAGRTRVTWTLRYERRLDPAWYFAPLERYGVSQAAGYLIDAIATPASAIAARTTDTRITNAPVHAPVHR